MGNLGGMELLVIFLVALMVLGPAKLPSAARQVGRAVNELRRVSGSFQQELRDALEEPMAEARTMVSGEVAEPTPAPLSDPDDTGDTDDTATPEADEHADGA